MSICFMDRENWSKTGAEIAGCVPAVYAVQNEATGTVFVMVIWSWQLLRPPIWKSLSTVFAPMQHNNGILYEWKNVPKTPVLISWPFSVSVSAPRAIAKAP